MENLSVVVFIVIAFFVLAWYAVKVVRQYDRLVVFRLGRVIGAKGPGLVWLWPFIDQATRVDLREQFLEIPSQTTITRDNAPIAVDFLIYWRVMNPEDSVVAVRDFAGASQGIATTTLRAVIGDIPLDDVLAKRDQINQLLQVKLDEVTERWGVKVTAVEIREITPPRDIQDAMNRQMAAERNRRATVTEAEGHRQATVTVAEGDKSATVLKAEGDRQAAILRAEGFSLALQQIFNVAHTVDERTMILQYFDTLKALGASPATKFIFPMEFTSMLQNFGRGIAAAVTPTDGGGGGGGGTTT
ncbi:MAG TPA: SPFH domain-containing protein [Dehalococcoidia bacterium]|nr:SPFH domain-containing protein [Dehalococcoidia bacterium]